MRYLYPLTPIPTPTATPTPSQVNNVLYVVVDALARLARPGSFTELTYTKVRVRAGVTYTKVRVGVGVGARVGVGVRAPEPVS